MYMSETVGVAQLRQNLSVYLRRIAEGERFVVTDRNKPVAELGPVLTQSSRIEQLIAEGKVARPTRTGPLPKPLKLDGDPNALSRALQAQRDEERR